MRKVDIICNKSVQELYKNMIYGKPPFKQSTEFKSIKSKLEEMKMEYKSNPIELSIICVIEKKLDKILTMHPLIMEKWINKIDKCCWHLFYKKDKNGNYADQTKFGVELLESLSYKRYQKRLLKEFFFKIDNNKTCVYCNAAYTLAYEDEKQTAALYQLDHIFPKKKYPYFSISLYNLVPSCANCNLNKGSKDFWTNEYYHPYLDSLADNFKFQLVDNSTDGLFVNTKAVDDLEKIKIQLSNMSNEKVKNHNAMFDLAGIYNNFYDIVQDILELGQLHPEVKREEYLKLNDGSVDRMFPDKETLERIYLRVYPNAKDINKRPLSKFIQDMARFSDFYDDKKK